MEKDKQIENVESNIIVLRGCQVMLDRDVAALYGVETREVNQALRNNPNKFPKGYVFTLQPAEKQDVIKKFDRFKTLSKSAVEPHAFTEKGLYMLATILKSPMATEATIAIIETFTKLRVLARELQVANNNAAKGFMPTQQKQNQIQNMMNEVFTNNLPVKMQKTTFGINLGFFKFTMETTRENEK